MRPRTLTTFAALVFFASVAPALHAQSEERQLQTTLGELAGAWSRGDANAIVALASRAGISLDIAGEAVGPLAARQAAAVLRNLIERRETVTMDHAGRVVGGVPPRAAGELTWITRARGTTEPERTTVFVELVREDDRWRVTYIRLLR